MPASLDKALLGAGQILGSPKKQKSSHLVYVVSLEVDHIEAKRSTGTFVVAKLSDEF